MRDRDYAVSFAFFVAGATFGATAALLLAPQSGRKTRRLLKRQGEDAVEYAVEKGHELYDRGREFADEAERVVGRMRNVAHG